jgi:hypothetical protein
LAIFICSGLLNTTGWAAQHSNDISAVFFSRAEKPSKDIIRGFNFDEYDRVKKAPTVG